MLNPARTRCSGRPRARRSLVVAFSPGGAMTAAKRIGSRAYAHNPAPSAYPYANEEPTSAAWSESTDGRASSVNEP